MTTQVRLPCSVRRCIVGNGILTHLVTSFNEAGGFMRRHAFLFLLFALTLSGFISAQAQTPAAAINHFKDAIKKSSQGDLDGAIEDYSRAIALSSRLSTDK